MNLLPFIELARDENPKPLLTADEVAACLYRAAQLAQDKGYDVGVLLKPHGAGGMCPVGRISLDILIDIPDQQEYDCFSSADGENGAPGPAIPTWHKLPFKVGVPPSGASMDRVRRPLGAVPTPEPEPEPPADPTDPPACQCGEVVEMLTAMQLKDAERHEVLLMRLEALEKANEQPRAFKGSARFIGPITGEVAGAKG